MPKISRYGGPSYTLAEPGDIVEQADGRISAHHPEEQNALRPNGDSDDSEWLRNKDGYDDQGYPVNKNEGGEDVSPGDSSSPSSESGNSSQQTKPSELPKRVRTAVSPSDATTPASSGVDSADGATKAQSTAKK